MLDHGLLADAIHRQSDRVPLAIRLYLDASLSAIKHEGHGDDRLERVALSSPVGGHVGLPTGDPDREIEHAVERLGRQSWAVVGDLDPTLVDRDRDHRRDTGVFAGVEGVVDQLLQRDEGPLVLTVPGLRDQLLAGAEVEQPAGTERGSLQRRGGQRAHVVTSGSSKAGRRLCPCPPPEEVGPETQGGCHGRAGGTRLSGAQHPLTQPQANAIIGHRPAAGSRAAAHGKHAGQFQELALIGGVEDVHRDPPSARLAEGGEGGKPGHEHEPVASLNHGIDRPLVALGSATLAGKQRRTHAHTCSSSSITASRPAFRTHGFTRSVAWPSLVGSVSFSRSSSGKRRSR